MGWGGGVHRGFGAQVGVVAIDSKGGHLLLPEPVLRRLNID